MFFAKRTAQAAGLSHKKPASSVEADITGGSTLSSQAPPKQETSTASSRGSTLKKGMILAVFIYVSLLNFFIFIVKFLVVVILFVVIIHTCNASQALVLTPLMFIQVIKLNMWVLYLLHFLCRVVPSGTY